MASRRLAGLSAINWAFRLWPFGNERFPKTGFRRPVSEDWFRRPVLKPLGFCRTSGISTEEEDCMIIRKLIDFHDQQGVVRWTIAIEPKFLISQGGSEGHNRII
jgi:hypothetical protein